VADLLPWAFDAILHAQCEVIDFSFKVTRPAFFYSAMLFLVGGFSIPCMFVLAPTESKRPLREARQALLTRRDGGPDRRRGRAPRRGVVGECGRG
jgi:hypothetical protein